MSLAHEMTASLNTLINLPLLATIEEKDMKEFIGEATGRSPDSFKIRNRVWNSSTVDNVKKLPKLRQDGLIPGSPEAIAAMSNYVAQQKGRSFDENDMEEGIDLGSGLDEFELEIRMEELMEAAEIERGTVNIFAKG